ncbi:MAG: sigma-54 dependent transcriptional regulator [Gammaproteobacteria bacterium]
MNQPITLIVDDEPDIRELLELTLGRMKIQTHSAADLKEARKHLSQTRFDLCLTDMRLPDGNGIDLVREIQEASPDTPVAVITAHGNMETAVEALKAGAFDFIAKPVNLPELRKLINSALSLSQSPVDRRTRDTLLGDSSIMQTIRSTIAKLARSQAPVYISGESGTGKELVARLIHSKGARAEQPFIAVNCGAIPSELMESEFFGHKKGSFTGASSDKQGLFQAASGGTLFLDEVADLPLAMQVKLLRAIQEKAVRPIGESQEITTDIRILSATHKNLAQLVEAGDFRQDLFYRINVIELTVPNLRQRREDIPELATHILDKLCQTNGYDKPALTDEASNTLQCYAYPGNVRELENILERALALCDGKQITTEDLQLPTAAESLQQIPDDTLQPPEGIPLEDYLQSIERNAIEKALQQTANNKTAAAKILGITFRALRYRLQKLGME